MFLLDAAAPGVFGGSAGFGMAPVICIAALIALTAVVTLVLIRRRRKAKHEKNNEEDNK